MAKDDDFDDDDLDPNDNDGGQDDDDKDGDDWEPPKTKADFERMAREHGNAEAKKWRLRAQGRDPKWKPGGNRDDDPGTKKTELDDKATPDQIRAAARKELEAEYAEKAKGDNLRANVSVALMSAGLNLSEDEMQSPARARKAVSRIVNMLDLSSMHLEDDGEISGLDDEIADLKKSYPGLFKSGNSGTGARKPATRGGDAGPKRERHASGDDDADLKSLARAWFKD